MVSTIQPANATFWQRIQTVQLLDILDESKPKRPNYSVCKYPCCIVSSSNLYKICVLAISMVSGYHMSQPILHIDLTSNSSPKFWTAKRTVALGVSPWAGPGLAEACQAWFYNYKPRPGPSLTRALSAWPRPDLSISPPILPLNRPFSLNPTYTVLVGKKKKSKS